MIAHKFDVTCGRFNGHRICTYFINFSKNRINNRNNNEGPAGLDISAVRK
jgi:hypothetical protein